MVHPRWSVIRVSVDALCRDGTGQISRDPRKNCLKTRRECPTRPSKLTKSHSRASQYPAIHMLKSLVCGSSALHENSLTRDFTNSCHHHHHNLFFLFFSKPAISMLERVDLSILSRSVFRVGGGVHGHKAIVSFLFLVSTVDHGALRGRQ